MRILGERRSCFFCQHPSSVVPVARGGIAYRNIRESSGRRSMPSLGLNEGATACAVGTVVRQWPSRHRTMSAIKPILKRLHCPDALNLESFSPADPTSFSLLLQAMFGPEGNEGEDSFDILVCTPRWLALEVERKSLVDGRHHLVVGKFDLAQIRSFLVAYAKTCAGKTWPEVASKLSRLGKWEFEDYRP